MSNPINRQAVGDALGLDADHRTTDVFKRLVAAGLLPAPLDAAYDSFDLSAVQGKVASAASVVSFARKVVTEHRGGAKAVL
jgi:hypothetical protein